MNAFFVFGAQIHQTPAVKQLNSIPFLRHLVELYRCCRLGARLNEPQTSGKLREGIVSRAEYDAFTIQVHEQSVDLCLEAANFAELLKSLTHLVAVAYPQAATSGSDIATPMREKVLVEVLGAGYASRVSNGVIQLRISNATIYARRVFGYYRHKKGSEEQRRSAWQKQEERLFYAGGNVREQPDQSRVRTARPKTKAARGIIVDML
ncbi:hypothetical protein BJ741DRAFT_701040 [Chytriomyces cf. hyalinus JEL632]|nr:hypothetical protein BJ741DRAFT_701040 [Chytriomyces cf. hyalinus JEL632]